MFRLLTFTATFCRKLRRLLCACCLWLGRLLAGLQSSGFVDDVMFAHSGHGQGKGDDSRVCTQNNSSGGSAA